MKTLFIQDASASYSNHGLKMYHQQYPWACKIVKVDGGYMAFESIVDYDTWRKQK